MLVTVGKIVDMAIDLADMKSSQFIDTSDDPDSEIMNYINLAYENFYQRVVKANEHYFTTQYEFSVTSGTDTYDLPDDFYKVDGVDILVNSPDQWATCFPYMFKQRNSYTRGVNAFTWYSDKFSRYKVIANQIRFIPVPSTSYTVRLWYTPTPTTFTSFADTVQVVVGGDRFMALYVAILMLQKEESDFSGLAADLADVINLMLNTLVDRDQGMPAYIVDTDSVVASGWWPRVGSF